MQILRNLIFNEVRFLFRILSTLASSPCHIHLATLWILCVCSSHMHTAPTISTQKSLLSFVLSACHSFSISLFFSPPHSLSFYLCAPTSTWSRARTASTLPRFCLRTTTAIRYSIHAPDTPLRERPSPYRYREAPNQVYLKRSTLFNVMLYKHNLVVVCVVVGLRAILFCDCPP